MNSFDICLLVGMDLQLDCGGCFPLHTCVSVCVCVCICVRAESEFRALSTGFPRVREGDRGVASQRRRSYRDHPPMSGSQRTAQDGQSAFCCSAPRLSHQSNPDHPTNRDQPVNQSQPASRQHASKSTLILHGMKT